MAAIEYGSYYWCVILARTGADGSESVHLHADSMEIDENGTLLFRSAGRRPAGSEPAQAEKSGDDKEQKAKQGGADEKKGEEKPESGKMIYMAFAAGTWSVAYAAKLADGSAAAVEHWDAANGRPGLLTSVRPNSGAQGYFPKQ
jgi:hypothetical protein